MPRGRHRQAPPLHRLLLPVALTATSVVCVGGAWLVAGGAMDGRTLTLSGLTTAAAGAALLGSLALRAWDREAGRRVGELKAEHTRREWRFEERIAELEEALERANERRAAVERKLRGKRAELGRLRTEHAALLRRYATAETERASALEGRRLLAIEAAEPAKALPATATDHRQASGAPTALTYLQADQALSRLTRNAARQREAREAQATAERAVRRAAAVSDSGSGGDGGGFDFFGNNRPLRRGPSRTSDGKPARTAAPTARGPVAPTARGPLPPTAQGPLPPTARGPLPPTAQGPLPPTAQGPVVPAAQGGGASRHATPAGRPPAGPGSGDDPAPGRAAPAPRSPGAAGKVIDLGADEGTGRQDAPRTDTERAGRRAPAGRKTPGVRRAVR